MAEGEARSVRAADTASAIARDLWAFAKEPTPAPAQLSWGRTMLFALAVLFAIDLALAFGAYWLEVGLAASGHDFPTYVEEEMSLQWQLLGLLVLAPLFEEPLFRGWLSGSKTALRFAAIIWFAILAVIATALVSNDMMIGIASFLFFGIACAGAVQWLVHKDDEVERPQWFVRHYKWFVWGSALAFGLSHLLGYDQIDHPLDLMVVLSQTLGGLVLAYTRTRLGLGAAMAQHSAFNAVYFTVA